MVYGGPNDPSMLCISSAAVCAADRGRRSSSLVCALGSYPQPDKPCQTVRQDLLPAHGQPCALVAVVFVLFPPFVLPFSNKISPKELQRLHYPAWLLPSRLPCPPFLTIQFHLTQVTLQVPHNLHNPAIPPQQSKLQAASLLSPNTSPGLPLPKKKQIAVCVCQSCAFDG